MPIASGNNACERAERVEQTKAVGMVMVRDNIKSRPRLRSRSCSALEEFTQLVNISAAGVADDEVPQGSFRPRFDVESQLPAER